MTHTITVHRQRVAPVTCECYLGNGTKHTVQHQIWAQCSCRWQTALYGDCEEDHALADLIRAHAG
jgi:hypothetical protein